jgi:NDP-4-keto-2,6-dideoxyhexose 3-C-methyltransferase
MYKQISTCRICGNRSLAPVLDLGVQALTGVFPKARNQSVEEGPLELVRCHDDGGSDVCGLVQLRHSYEGSELYGMNYGYRSGLNASMVAHLEGKSRRIKERVRLSPGDIALDIGSNDGTFLRFMKEPGVERIGMDPTAAKFRSYYDSEVVVVEDFFSADRFRSVFGTRKARVVTSFSMFYDLETPLDFMCQVAGVLADDGIWVCEQSYLPAMLATNSYDTVCHEHLEYYALRQIQFMARRAGLKIVGVEFNDVNGGSFSFAAAKSDALSDESFETALRAETSHKLNEEATYRGFRQRTEAQREALRSFLGKWKADGRVMFGYGASTKGNVLLQYCGISESDLPCIAEVNADKFGSFTPGTLIPIVDEQAARAARPDGFMVLPWHFRSFIEKKEADFVSNGGSLLFPLPELDLVGGFPALAAAHNRRESKS